MGHRRGISRALEKKSIPYMVWSQKPLFNTLKAYACVVGEFPLSEQELRSKIPSGLTIDHVIAGTEGAVFPSSRIRQWLSTRSNPQAAIKRCTDKLSMKVYLKDLGIPMTDFIAGYPSLDEQKAVEHLGTPVIAKPRESSGSRGIKKIHTPKELRAFKDRTFIFEKAIDGTEGSVESFIVDGQIVFANITQYLKIGHVNLVPGHYAPAEASSILSLNRRVIEGLKVNWGMTHLEFYRTSQGLLFGEVALRPPGGFIMEAMALAYGLDFWDLFLAVEMGHDYKLPDLPPKYAAAHILYANQGTLSAPPKPEAFSNLSSLKRLKLKWKSGQVVKARQGLGENHGHALFLSNRPQDLLRDLESFESTINQYTPYKA